MSEKRPGWKRKYPTPGFKNGFGALYRVKTRKHLRTSRSVRASTGPGQIHWPETRDVETATLNLQDARLKRWRRLHEERRAA